MVTIEDKIRLFSKIVYDKIDEELNEEMKKIEAEREEIIKKEETKIQEEKERALKEINRKSQLKAREIISKAKFDMKREILELREKIIDDTLKDIIDELNKYADTDEYKIYLYREIENNIGYINRKDFILYLNKKDFQKYKDDLVQKFKIDVKCIDRDIIGGFIFNHKNNKLRIDCSLYSKVEKSRESIGIKITKLLNE